MPRRVTRSGAALAAAVAVACLASPAAALGPTPSAGPAETRPGPQVIAAYALAAPRSESASGLLARAVVPAGSRCPTLRSTDTRGRSVDRPLRVRPTPPLTAPAFDAITVCETEVPPGSRLVDVSGVPIPARMPERVERLALLGDSGCRIVAWEIQDCASTDAWPFARVAQSIARQRPDAILVNGDWFYREAPCPASAQGLCGSSPPPVAGLPFTDSAYGWISDALLPMAPMLSVAPLIVTRGNHEACNRGGNGFFLLLDPRKGTSYTCAPTVVDSVLTAAPTVPTPSYAIDLAVEPGRTLRLAVVDSAGGSDIAVTPYSVVQRTAYEEAATLTRPKPGRESWLYTHRPLYGFVSTAFAAPGVPFNPWSSMDQAAAAYGLLGTYDLVFSSHLHLAQAVQMPGLPPQLVLGNAGTLLDPPAGYPLPASGAVVGPATQYPAPESAWVDVRFGYALAAPGRTAGTWRLTLHDPAGTRVARCGLAEKRLYCRSS